MKPPASLVMVKGKWHVQITVPKEKREALNGRKQMRLSTGTSDRRLAEQLLHDKAQELYDKLPDDRRRPLVVKMNLKKETFNESSHRRLQEYLEDISDDPKNNNTIRWLADRWLETNPYPTHKTKREAETAIEDFIKDNGNMTVESLTARTGYRWAEKLGKTKSNKTLRKKIGYVSRALSWSERKGFAQLNPFFGLKLGDYGTKTKSYLPFTTKELEALFDQEMPGSHRLLLEILTTTGMRLDEAALLTWDDIKEEDDVLYFDLTDHDKPIKTIGSRRKVPVPECLLPKFTVAKSGHVFPEFKRNADGKAQGPASKALMSHVRKVTKNERKAVHSLRGTCKDQLRNAGVPKETNDFITGHSEGDVAGKYGLGPSLKVRKEALDRPDWSYILKKPNQRNN